MDPEPMVLLLELCEWLEAESGPHAMMHPLAWERLLVFVVMELFRAKRYLSLGHELLLSFCPQAGPEALMEVHQR